MLLPPRTHPEPLKERRSQGHLRAPMSSSDKSSPTSSTFDVPTSYAPSDASDANKMSTSLFINLTQTAGQGYPVTELIKYLIEAIGHDVVTFQRNTQVSYRLVDRVRNICDKINDLIAKLEEEDSWDNYDKFSEAIDPLEDLLFQLTTLSEDEASHYLADATALDNSIISANKWEANRKELREALEKLRTETKFTCLFPDADEDEEKEEIDSAAKHDDNTFYAEVVQHIKDFDIPPTARGAVPGLITEVTTRFESLQTKLHAGEASDGLTVLTIKSAMILHGAMGVAGVANVDQEWKYHLWSEAVWKAAEALLQRMVDLAEDDEDEYTEIDTEYKAFIELLRNTPGVELPESFNSLMKHASKTRRPYLAQALALVALCRSLAKEFDKSEKKTRKNVYSLEDAIEGTLTALQAGVDAVTQINLFNLDDFETHAATSSYVDAKDKVKTAFTDFGLATEWTAKEKTFAAAVKADKDRLTALNQKITARPARDPNATSTLIQVNVKVTDKTKTINNAISLSTDPKTRLRAVLYEVSKSLSAPEATRALSGGAFTQEAADGTATPHGLQKTVSELASGQTCELTLVIP
ncbi:hypothetical protein FA95DRAFT_1041453 [Auriscalpium vulgare]|uniref:Uncharacterized protein n=1 Tax=Auriscalpium vulgare TaxID=40419 RepID=A0ACB8RX00_9AGAM|nr:hypothetical protein FA95DRAFT_1041453 [Auriscalpium vulgare]